MRKSRVLISTAIAAIVGVSSSFAMATPAFPSAMQSSLSLSYTPSCSVCHPGGVTGANTATTPFALAMKQFGLVAGDSASLAAALTKLQAASTDSDCDGVFDADQLKAGRDPSTGEYIDGSGKTAPAAAGCGAASAVTPTFGCGARIAPSPAPWQGALAVVAFLGFALVRRRC